jgi:hypothetical protein
MHISLKGDRLEVTSIPVDERANFCGYTPENYSKAFEDPNIRHIKVAAGEVLRQMGQNDGMRAIWKTGNIDISPISVSDEEKKFCGYSPENYAEALNDQNIRKREIAPEETVLSDDLLDTILIYKGDLFTIQLKPSEFCTLVDASKLAITDGEDTLYIYSKWNGPSHPTVPFLIKGESDSILIINANGLGTSGEARNTNLSK